MKTSKQTVLGALLVCGMVLLLEGGAGPVFASEIRSTNPAQGDFLPAHNFKIEIDGVVVGNFSDTSGVESSVEVIEPSSDDPSVTQKRPGRAKYGNIVMKRAYLGDDNYLATWFKKVLNGTTERKSGSIIYLDREGNEVLRYNFFEAWPARRHVGVAPKSVLTKPLDPQMYIVEEIEFVVEKVERN